jgi:hypothetical protein
MYLYGSKVKVSSLRRTLRGVPQSLVFEALTEVLEHLAGQGVRPGSLSAMSWNLWRSTLTAPIDLGFDPGVGRQALFGGRQESPSVGKLPGTYVAVDLKKAYPSSMAARPYATGLRRVANDTFLDPEIPGLATATVSVPDDVDHPFAPLPVRVAKAIIQWRWGTIEGTWSWGELAAARDIGCEVVVTKCWAPLALVDLFSAWFDLVRNAEYATVTGANLMKAVANNLWGNFALDGSDRSTITWSDDYGDKAMIVSGAEKRLPHARLVHVAAETTSRVRVRMLREGLYGDYETPVHIDTDGIIVSLASAARRVKGVGPGEWRDKTIMSRLEVKGPQLYRHHCVECGIMHAEWHYVAAGIPARHVADFFEKTHPGFPISFSGIDQVLPASHTEMTAEQRRRWYYAAVATRQAAFGHGVFEGRAS